jgi:hypothetical protein
MKFIRALIIAAAIGSVTAIGVDLALHKEGVKECSGPSLKIENAVSDTCYASPNDDVPGGTTCLERPRLRLSGVTISYSVFTPP